METNSKSYFKRTLAKIKNIMSLSEHIDISSAAENIVNNVEFRGSNTYILAFAIVIASVGLNVNSIPVIIGAMLISPLMGPIIAIGYSLGVNDTSFLKKSAFNLLIMVVISIIASFLYFLLSPLELENPTELLSRTNPTIFDVLIALFGGFAGILEITKKNKGTVLPGVAIATAIMPPLCTAGFGLATGSLSYFFGALYLFFINCVFIALSTFITVKYLRFPVKSFADPNKQRKVTRIISAFTLILIIPSIFSAIIVIRENSFNHTVKKFITQNKTLPRSYIYDYNIDHSHNQSIIEISIAGDALEDIEVEALYNSFESFGLDREQLSITQNAVTVENDITDKAVVQSIFERNDLEIKQREKLIQEKDLELMEYKKKDLPYKQIAKEVTVQYPNMISFTISRGANVDPNTLESIEQIILTLKLSTPISDLEINKIEKWLQVRLDFNNIKVIQEN